MKSVPDLTLQLVLYHADKAQWPPYTYIFFELLEALRHNRYENLH